MLTFNLVTPTPAAKKAKAAPPKRKAKATPKKGSRKYSIPIRHMLTHNLGQSNRLAGITAV
jgi:hypothetical protein